MAGSGWPWFWRGHTVCWRVSHLLVGMRCSLRCKRWREVLAQWYGLAWYKSAWQFVLCGTVCSEHICLPLLNKCKQPNFCRQPNLWRMPLNLVGLIVLTPVWIFFERPFFSGWYCFIHFIWSWRSCPLFLLDGWSPTVVHRTVLRPREEMAEGDPGDYFPLVDICSYWNLAYLPYWRWLQIQCLCDPLPCSPHWRHENEVANTIIPLSLLTKISRMGLRVLDLCY